MCAIEAKPRLALAPTIPTRILLMLLVINASADTVPESDSHVRVIIQRCEKMWMDRPKFETELRGPGYAEIVDRRMEANAVNPEHAH